MAERFKKLVAKKGNVEKRRGAGNRCALLQIERCIQRRYREKHACSTERQSGAVIVLLAAALFVLIGLSAIVVDIGFNRADKRNLSSVADLSALAAGSAMGDKYAGYACNDAFEYLQINIPEFKNATNPCAGLPIGCINPDVSSPPPTPPATPPTPATQPKDVVTTAGEYVATFRYPVSDWDIYDPSIAYPSPRDGAQCDRLRVTVSHKNETMFGYMLGVDSLTPVASATVRATPKSSQVIPSLWLLDPRGCPVLETSGGSRLYVGTPDNPGVISLDSDTTSCGSNVALYSDNNSGIYATPKFGNPRGIINLFSMPPHATTCGARDCDQNKVGPTQQIWPQPSPQLRRSTRAPVDHRYNCKQNYPAYMGIPIRDCRNAGNETPNIDALRQAVGITGKGTFNAGTPAGYQVFTSLPGGQCNLKQNMEVFGNLWINCAGSGLRLNSVSLTVHGNVILDGDIVSNSGGTFVVDPIVPGPLPEQCKTAMSSACIALSTKDAAFLVQRTAGSGLEISGSIQLKHTAVVQNGGCLKFNAGATPNWSAPEEGVFRGLSLWSEYCTESTMTGGTNMSVKGTFFAPDAVFNISGNGEGSQQDAQFIAYRMRVTGGGSLKLAPNPLSAVTIDTPKATLIR